MITEEFSEHYTHGEPWAVLLFKIAVALCLTPAHHIVEEKTLHYFYEHKLIESSRNSLYAGVQRLKTWTQHRYIRNLGRGKPIQK